MEERNGFSLRQPPLSVPLLVQTFNMRSLAESWRSHFLWRSGRMSCYSFHGWEQVRVLWVIPDESWLIRILFHGSRYCHFMPGALLFLLLFFYELLSHLQCPLAPNSSCLTWKLSLRFRDLETAGSLHAPVSSTSRLSPMTGGNGKDQLPSSCMNFQE